MLNLIAAKVIGLIDQNKADQEAIKRGKTCPNCSGYQGQVRAAAHKCYCHVVKA